MRMNQGVYDALKNVAQIYLPAAGTLYFALASIWGLPAAGEVTGTVIAIDTFLGVILGISSASYNATSKYAGSIVVTTHPEDGRKVATLDLSQNPDGIVAGKDMTFKVINS